MSAWDSLFSQHKVVACVGPGGVGKTTLSAAIALGAARRGYRALVLTIDPARRLADALGVAIGSEPTPIPTPILAQLGISEGRLSALMLDTQSTFDSMVERFARDETTRQRILDNEIYARVSDALAGSTEYSAMEKLAELVELEEYDLIVLDTPPSAHALDFLEAPERLLGLIDSRIAKLLIRPAMNAGRFGQRLFQRSTAPLFSLIERITGLGFLEELSEFLLIFEEMSDGFRARATSVRKLLFGGETAFLLVSGPGSGQVEQALALEHGLEELGVPVRGVLLNRMRRWPDEISAVPEASWRALEAIALDSNLESSQAEEELRAARDAYQSYDAWVQQDASAVLALEERARELGALLWRIPEAMGEVHDLTALERIEAQLTEPTG